MKFYKIVDCKTGHRGISYEEGENVDPLDFNPSGDCEGGGIYFAREDIFSFFEYGEDVYEATPVGEVYENPGSPKKWKCKIVILRKIGKTSDLDVVKQLVEDGADIHSEDDYILRLACFNGNLKIAKYLAEQGANIHANDDEALYWARELADTKIINFLRS